MPKGFSPELSDAVCRVLQKNGNGKKQMTLKVASELSGVGATLIQQMSTGKVIGCEGVIRFAKAFDEENVALWLEMCGYDDIAELMKDKVIVKVTEPSEFEEMLDSIPLRKRTKARDALRNVAQSVILPLFTDAAA